MFPLDSDSLFASGRPLSRIFWEKFSILSLVDTALSFCLLVLQRFPVVGEPWSWWILYFNTLRSYLLQFLHSFGRGHWSLQFLILWELVWLQVLAHDQRCPVDHSDRASCAFDSFNSLYTCIRDLKVYGSAQTLSEGSEFICTLSKHFHSVLDLGEDSSFE